MTASRRSGRLASSVRQASTSSTSTSRSTINLSRASSRLVVIWALNNFDALKRLGTGIYFYIPEDADASRSAHRREDCWRAWKSIIGVPAGTFKIKMLYEEGNGGRYLPAIAWTFRRRLLGTNVAAGTICGSLIEMWKDDPNGSLP